MMIMKYIIDFYDDDEPYERHIRSGLLVADSYKEAIGKLEDYYGKGIEFISIYDLMYDESDVFEYNDFSHEKDYPILEKEIQAMKEERKDYGKEA